MVGKEINSREIVEKLQEKARTRVALNKVTPKLAIIQVGEDKASCSYVKNKIKTGEKMGVEVRHFHFREEVTEGILIDFVNKCNKMDFDGIIVQLPLPPYIDERRVLNMIDPSKDVDGLGLTQIGYLHGDDTRELTPCTALGVFCMLKETTEIEGKDVVIINRSNLIGKPLQAILTYNNATVTLCHSRTKNLKEKVLNADIVVTGIGTANFFDETWFKDGQIIIDCSMNRNDEGKLCGDVNKERVMKAWDVQIASGIGHTGLFTTTMLMHNTISSAYRRV